MSEDFHLPLEPTRDKLTLRRQLQAERLAMSDRHERSVHLQEVLRVWLVSRSEQCRFQHLVGSRMRDIASQCRHVGSHPLCPIGRFHISRC